MEKNSSSLSMVLAIALIGMFAYFEFLKPSNDPAPVVQQPQPVIIMPQQPAAPQYGITVIAPPPQAQPTLWLAPTFPPAPEQIIPTVVPSPTSDWTQHITPQAGDGNPWNSVTPGAGVNP